MAVIGIPLQNIPRQQMEILADGKLMRITVWWQPNDSSWYLSLETPPGTLVIAGRRITLNRPLLPHTSAVSGNIFCRKIQSLSDVLDRTAWPDKFRLVFES